MSSSSLTVTIKKLKAEGTDECYMDVYAAGGLFFQRIGPFKSEAEFDRARDDLLLMTKASVEQIRGRYN